jgi:phage tail-like protein
VNPKDTLIAGANGRYLRFKIELLSDETGKNTPLIKQLRVYFPRITYLRYLPETYQEDAKKRDFLERFLSLFETFMSHSEEQVVDFTKYLDPSSVPGKFIPWLSSWLAIAHDENWSLEKKRELIRQAARLYKIRGTPRIFRQIIKLFYGKSPIVVEPFQFNCIDNPEIKKQMKELFGFQELVDESVEDRPHRFTVVVPPRWEDPDSLLKTAEEVTAVERNTMQRIVDTEKPADTTGTLQVLEPWFYLDMHTYLGINTLLTKTEFVLGQTSVIGRDTVIDGKEKAGQLGRKSRIGIDLTLT